MTTVAQTTHELTDWQQFVQQRLNGTSTKPRHQFVARAAKQQEPPTFYYSLPLGDVYLYDDYLVFLTLVQGQPGTGMLFKTWAQEMIDMTKAGKTLVGWSFAWEDDPVGVLREIGQWLSKELKNEDVLARALANPNSLFVPLKDLREVKTGLNRLQGNCIQMRTTATDYVLCQDCREDSFQWCGLGHFTAMWSLITGNWQTEVVEFLNSHVQKRGGVI
jgi:hypothetical protein